MKAFISYSHQDTAMLELLHKHLTQLQRDHLIRTWEDREIPAGGKLDTTISTALEESQLFLALLSPDYIASNYCYEREFQKALQMQEEGRLIIVPVILEPCDWHHTPFSQFKAVPKDGKAISLWENKNTAFLDVSQNLRKLVQGNETRQQPTPAMTKMTRNYRVQKDFDSIQKLEFLETTFQEVKDYIKRYAAEVSQLENIKVKELNDTNSTYECILVNRNKINTEAQLTITTGATGNRMPFHYADEKAIHYTISKTSQPVNRTFQIANDEYELFWTENNLFGGNRATKLSSSKDLAELIWNDWLGNVGIL